jgi:hypothetical protein
MILFKFLYIKLNIEEKIVFFIMKYLINKHKSKISKKNNIKPRLFWGPMPILNNYYFSNALKQVSYKSETIMFTYYSNINNKNDFDKYPEDILIQYKLPKLVKKIFREWLILDYCLKNFDIFHIPFSGGILGETKYWKKELHIYKSTGKKIIMLPYGADFYQYSKIKSVSLQHVLLLSYPMSGKNEKKIQEKFNFWQITSDFVMGSIQCPDGFSLWHNLPVNYLVLDSKSWIPKLNYTPNNGINGIVKIIHTPNHRGFKGTEFIINAVNELKKEGLKIELILLEGVKNSEVKRIMSEDADILVEQLIFTGYALSGLEGMASGLPVLSNLEDENYTRLFRRYSYLNECPILSSSPENVKENLKLLILNPDLRESLGSSGVKYVEKYHSYKSAQYMFSKIYDKIWYNQEVDLMNMYNPLNPDSYNNKSEYIFHPLFENKLINKYTSEKNFNYRC